MTNIIQKYSREIIAVAAVLLIVLTVVFADRTAGPNPELFACTMEAKICPDGSTVGRTGPSCAFAECPATATTTPITTPPTNPATPPTPEPTKPQVLAYGNVFLQEGETITYPDITVTLLRIPEDSRCASDVTCIWAGTLRAEFQVIARSKASTTIIELGKSVTINNVTLTLVSASPYPKSTKQIAPGEYRLTLSVQKKITVSPTPAPKPVQSACYVGGCSGEICSDQKDMASNCIYREEFACYRNTTCERQASGACGWTETPALKACLLNPTQLQ